MKQLKAIHDLFLFKDDLFRNEAEIFRNKLCTGIGQNSEPYAPPTVVLGRPRALLPYQEMVIYNVMVLSFLLTSFIEAS